VGKFIRSLVLNPHRRGLKNAQVDASALSRPDTQYGRWVLCALFTMLAAISQVWLPIAVYGQVTSKSELGVTILLRSVRRSSPAVGSEGNAGSKRLYKRK
jgi:hypothetical protein